MSESTKRVHLGYGPDGKKVGDGYSGRAVKFRMLTAPEVVHIKEQMGKAIEADTRLFEFDDKVAGAAIDKMVEAITEPLDPAKLADAKWESMDVAQMMARKATLFTAKDIDLLKTLYLRNHHVTGKELDAIMGGIIGVVD